MDNLIDRVAGLNPESVIHAARRQRQVFVDGTEECRVSVLEPSNGLGLFSAFRKALAARIAALIGPAELSAAYRKMAGDADAVLCAVAQVRDLPPDAEPRLQAMVRHADLVTKTPKASAKFDIEALAAAGLSNPQIVALSELIAFVNYEARVAAGLKLLGGMK